MKINTQAFRRLMVERHVTRRELGERVGISQQAISKISTGKNGAKPENLYKICDALGCTLDELVEEW